MEPVLSVQLVYIAHITTNCRVVGLVAYVIPIYAYYCFVETTDQQKYMCWEKSDCIGSFYLL